MTSAKLMGAILIGMGIAHEVAPKPFESIVPPQLPGSPRSYNYLSGLWEVATGSCLLRQKTRGLGGLSAALLFLAVWPANIYHAIKDLNAGAGSGKKIYHFLRQPAQILLIWQALRVAKAASKPAEPS